MNEYRVIYNLGDGPLARSAVVCTDVGTFSGAVLAAIEAGKIPRNVRGLVACFNVATPDYIWQGTLIDPPPSYLPVFADASA